jgi:hypothetical protein
MSFDDEDGEELIVKKKTGLVAAGSKSMLSEQQLASLK